MEDKTRIYVRKDLKRKMKVLADVEGRTLEWMVNKALETFINMPDSELSVKDIGTPVELTSISDMSGNIVRDLRVDNTPTLAMERACCAAAKPCQHWQYNVNTAKWVNTLSGRVKEVA